MLEGKDPFGYGGMPAEASDEQMLSATFDTDYPDAPYQLLRVFGSPRSGDMIVSARKGYDLRYRHEHPEHKSTHGSLHRDHMHVPLMMNTDIAAECVRTVDVFPAMLNLTGRTVKRDDRRQRYRHRRPPRGGVGAFSCPNRYRSYRRRNPSRRLPRLPDRPDRPRHPSCSRTAGYLGYDRTLLRPMSFATKLRALLKYLWVRLKGGPMTVNMEVTYLCNATCDFCDYWKTKRSGKLGDYDYVAALRKLNPLSVTLTGGEPTINKQLPEAVMRIKESLGFVYISMVTHGSLLTVEKAHGPVGCRPGSHFDFAELHRTRT